MNKNEEMVQDDEFSPDELIIRKKKTPELRTGVTAESVLKTTADALESLRAKNPLIECITSLAGATQAANALFAAVSRASAILKGAGYKADIEEIHHIHKLDAPSGTAKTLASLVEEGLGTKPEITSIREGEVPGIHTLTLESACDKLTFRHEAFSREGFAQGAVTAALLTEGLQGVHEFSELL